MTVLVMAVVQKRRMLELHELALAGREPLAFSVLRVLSRFCGAK